MHTSASDLRSMQAESYGEKTLRTTDICEPDRPTEVGYYLPAKEHAEVKRVHCRRLFDKGMPARRRS